MNKIFMQNTHGYKQYASINIQGPSMKREPNNNLTEIVISDPLTFK